MPTRRNECYPAAHPVGWDGTKCDHETRREQVEWRNDMIAEVGAARAVEAVKGGTIGAGAKGKKEEAKK